MKPFYKYYPFFFFLVFTMVLHAQPGLNIQNRINSTVQTRVRSKLINMDTSQRMSLKVPDTTQNKPGKLSKTQGAESSKTKAEAANKPKEKVPKNEESAITSTIEMKPFKLKKKDNL